MEDKYIKLLQIAKHKSNTIDENTNTHGISYGEMKGLVGGLEILRHPQHVYEEVCGTTPSSDDNRNDMSLDAYFKLLEYDELKQAREDSKQARNEARKATYIAIAAIAVNVLLALYQIYLTALQLIKP